MICTRQTEISRTALVLERLIATEIDHSKMLQNSILLHW
jgi:hypothetical protein